MAKGTDIKQLFSAEDDACLSPEEMRAYLKGEAAAPERHRVEMHLLNCELCAIAYEDWDPAEAESLKAGADAISTEAWNRVQEKKRRGGAIVWMSVAAGVMLLITTAWWMFKGPSEEKMEEVYSHLMDQTLREDTNLKANGGPTTFAHAPDANVAPVPPAPVEVIEERTSVETEDVVAMESMPEEQMAAPKATATGTSKADWWANDNAGVAAKDKLAESDAVRDEEMLADDQDFGGDVEPVRTMTTTAEKKASPVKNQEMADGKANRKSTTDKFKKETESKNLDAVAVQSAGKGGAVKSRSNAEPTPAVAQTTAPQQENAFAGLAMADSIVTDSRNKASTYSLGMDAYAKRDFTQSAILLRKAATETPNHLEAHLHAGISFLNINQPQAAIYHLDRVLAVSGTNLREDAEWYKALAYLRMNEARKAKSLLESISKQNGKHAKAAQKALDDLK